MICQDCQGTGRVMRDREGKPVERLRDAVMMIPCPSCGGCGIASCCDVAGSYPVPITAGVLVCDRMLTEAEITRLRRIIECVWTGPGAVYPIES